MHLRHLTLSDFRSYPMADVALEPGVTTFVGHNGQGKTNLVEAAGYLASLSSHRVSSDGPLIRAGATQAIIRGAVVHDGREQLLEIELNPGKANRARLGRAAPTRPREILGALRTVLFAPEDLALVKGDPSERRRFLDDLLVSRQPRWAGARADYDKIVKQRNALLRSASGALRAGRRGGSGDQDVDSAVATLDVWDAHLVDVGSSLVYARLRLLRDLGPHLGQAYDEVSAGRSDARATYVSSLHEQADAALNGEEVPERDQLATWMRESLAAVRSQEIERGVTLVGPHRDDVRLDLGELPAKGYASHGESWSFALGLRLAAFQLLRTDLRTDPVLILDDVFAELDAGRRTRLAGLIADAEQVLITAAVGDDIPESLSGKRFHVERGSVQPVGDAI
ncbi:DNA replication/repair protein RecF [Dermacoccaceae bacterium W4C1]